MPWKMNGENIATKDGNPVWIDKDGTEVAADYEHALGKINQLTGESASRKTKLREAEEKLAALDGIEDPADFIGKARKALETVKNLDDKKLIDAGEVEKVKAEVTKAMQAKIDEATKRADESAATLQKEMVGGRFARSKFISDKIAVPGDMIEAMFGRHFAIEDGVVVAKGHDGQKLYSREKPGELAGFDEALSMLVDGYPNKASILKGSNASGSGTTPGGTGGASGTKTMSRSEFEKQEPSAQMKFVKDGGKVTD